MKTRLLKLSLLMLALYPLALVAKSCPYGLSDHTLEEACSKNLNSYRSKKEDCLLAGRDEYLDGCALDFCARLDRLHDKLTCIRSIGGRTYKDDDLSDCLTRFKSDETDGIDCLAVHGTSIARLQMLELSKERGYREGARAAEDEDPQFDLTIAETRGTAGGVKVGETFLSKTAFNLGYEEARKAAAPPDAAAYAAGQTAGENLAVNNAKDYERRIGFNEALSEAEKSKVAPPHLATFSLKEDKTPSLEGPGTLSVLRMSAVSVGNAPIAPTPIVLTPPNKLPPGDHVPANSELPNLTPTLPAPTNEAPCVIPGDADCLRAFREGYSAGFTREVQSRYSRHYRKIYRQAFEASLAVTLKGVAEPQHKQNGLSAASKERGLLDAYVLKYASEKQAKNKEGRLDFVTELKQRPLVKVVSAYFESAAGPYLIPSNEFTLTVELDNLSDTDAPGGYYRINLPKDSTSSKPAELAHWNPSTRVLPAIPANSRTKFQFAFNGVARSVKTGESKIIVLSLEALESDYTGKNLTYRYLAPVVATAIPNYPLELVSVKEQDKLVAGKEVTAIVTVKNNRTERSLPYRTRLMTDPQSIVVSPEGGIEIPPLDPGQTYDYEVRLNPSVWVNYRSATDFLFRLANTENEMISHQILPKMVDLGIPLGLRVAYQGGDVSNRTIEIPANYKAFGIQVQLDCSRKIELNEGYTFRYSGSTDPSFNFVGTVGGQIGGCTPNRPRYLASGSIWTPGKQVAKPAALQFVIEQNGVIIQGVQVFVKTLPSTSTGGGYCGSCR